MPSLAGLASVKQCCQLIQFRLAFIYTLHFEPPPPSPSAVPGKSIAMHAPHWLHLTAFNCNGPHEMSTASPSRQTFGLAYFSNCLPLSRSATVSLSLGGTGAGAFGFGSLFLRLTQKEKQNDVALDFSAFHVLQPVQVFLLGFPAFVKGTKTTLMPPL